MEFIHLLLSNLIGQNVQAMVQVQVISRGVGLASFPGHTHFSMLHAEKGKAWFAKSHAKNGSNVKSAIEGFEPVGAE